MARKKDRKPRKFYSSGPVKRGAAPLVRITKDKYRRALPELRRDFEDPKTHELVGTTPAAIYHIDTIDLNDPGLVNERRYRYELFAKLDYLAEGELTPDMKQVVDSLRDELKRCIPRIPPPENYWSVE